jgi:hypothetical protein
VNYATWNLRKVSDDYLDGPESLIVDRGGSAQSVWADGAVETGATILGKVSGDLSNLSEWNVTAVTRQEAEAFIQSNFVEFVNSLGDTITLQDALQVLN